MRAVEESAQQPIAKTLNIVRDYSRSRARIRAPADVFGGLGRYYAGVRAGNRITESHGKSTKVACPFLRIRAERGFRS